MHCITFVFSQCFIHFRGVFYMLKPCVLVVFDWIEPMMFILLHVTCSCIFHAYIPFFSFLWYYCWLVLFCFSLSLSLIVCAWHPSTNLLHLETLFVLGHLLLLILILLTFDSVIRRPVRTSRRTFLDVVFIWNARSFFLTSSILIYPLSFTIRVGNPFVISWSIVLPWSYRSFTPICTDLITPYLAFSLLFKVSI